MTTRRGLLKFFGIGTVIAPLVDGAVPEVLGKLIEVPKVELVKDLPKAFDPIDLDVVRSVEVTLTMKDGTKRTVSSIFMLGRSTSRPTQPGDDLNVAIKIGHVKPGTKMFDTIGHFGFYGVSK